MIISFIQIENDRLTNRTIHSRIYDKIWKDLVLFLTFVGIIIGFVVGISIRETDPSDDVIMWLGKFLVITSYHTLVWDSLHVLQAVGSLRWS